MFPRAPLIRSALPLVALLGTLVTPPARAQDADGHWSQFFDDWPVNVQGTTVYDPVRDRMLLISSFGVIWELPFEDPLAWRRLPEPGGGTGTLGNGFPVYDSIGDRVVYVEPVLWPDSMRVWQLTLVEPMNWTRMPTVAAPASNWFPSGVVFDPVGDCVRVFGGTTPPPFGGPVTFVDWTARIDVSTSTAVFTASSNTGLGARGLFAYAVDPTRGRVVVYGGRDRTQTFSDVKVGALGAGVLVFSSAATAGGPPPAMSARLMYDPPRDRMLLCGGGSGGLWQLTPGPTMQWSAVAIAGIAPSSGGSPLFDAGGDRAISFGAGTRDGLWTLQLAGTTTWTDYSLPHPEGGGGRVLVHDEQGSRLIVHGDSNKNDVWSLALAGPPGWTKLVTGGTPPPERNYHTGVYDAGRGRMLIFGGEQAFPLPRLNDVWALSLGPSPAWSSIAPLGTPPPARSRHAAIYDPVRDRMLIWGGSDGSTSYDDVWALDLAATPTWTQLAPAGTPPASTNVGDAVYDPVQDRMIVLGAGAADQTWALSLSGAPAWTQLPTCPGTDPAPALDSRRERIVVLSDSDQVYELTLASPEAWRQMAPTGTGPDLSGPDLVYDPGMDRMIVMPSFVTGVGYSLDFDLVGAVPGPTGAAGMELAQSEPNPAAHAPTIHFSLRHAERVEVTVHDVAGRLVRTLADAGFTAGQHRLRWDLDGMNGEIVASGLYFYTLRAGDVRLTRRLVVTR